MTPAERRAAVTTILELLRRCGDWWSDVLAEVCRAMLEGYVAGIRHDPR